MKLEGPRKIKIRNPWPRPGSEEVTFIASNFEIMKRQPDIYWMSRQGRPKLETISNDKKFKNAKES
ncbi:MAG TPA: hypothetical protein VMW89_16940 [Desulfatiglandales bacterium]|nr:hypothetical protein [Desulfatiglandales bacterium]